MNEALLEKFTSYYKRIMRVESELKHLIFSKYCEAYKEKVYKIVYYGFLIKTENNRHSQDTIYTKLFNSNESEQNKLSQAISKMYLGEVIDFFGHPVFLKNTVRKKFFNQSVNTKSTDFQSKAKQFRAFRNCVAHVDERKLKMDGTRFLNALIYFERLLGFNNNVVIDTLSKINPNHKLSTYEILEIIYKEQPEAYKNDRILTHLFDEIAILNGCQSVALPQLWTILRQKFKLLNDIKEQNNSTDQNNGSQLKLNLKTN